MAKTTKVTEAANEELLPEVEGAVETPAVSSSPPVSLIYAGPTMHRRVIIHGSVYRGGIPGHIRQLIEKVPDVERLVVPVKDFAAVRKATQTQGTEEHRLYNYLYSVRFNEDGGVRT